MDIIQEFKITFTLPNPNGTNVNVTETMTYDIVKYDNPHSYGAEYRASTIKNLNVAKSTTSWINVEDAFNDIFTQVRNIISPAYFQFPPIIDSFINTELINKTLMTSLCPSDFILKVNGK